MSSTASFTAAMAAALLATSCATTRTLFVDATPETGEAGSLRKKSPIAPYTTRDGRRHEFRGFVEVDGNSLRFVRPAAESRGLELARPGEVRVIPRDSVIAVQEYRENKAGTAVLLVAAGALAWLALEVATFDLWGSR